MSHLRTYFAGASKSQEYGGKLYQSGFEASYAKELDKRLKKGEIVKWERQVKLDLKVNGLHITNYYIDFLVYFKDGHREFVECKGMEMDVWKMKWKIFEAIFVDQFMKDPGDKMIVVKQKKWLPKFPRSPGAVRSAIRSGHIDW